MANVLYVDGDSGNAEELAKCLESVGHAVRVASSAEKAMLDLESEGKLDALVVCLHLPGMDGAELCRWLRKRPDGADLRTIAFTPCGRPLPNYLRATRHLWLPVDQFLGEACDAIGFAESIHAAILNP